MRFVKMLAASAALACAGLSGQAQALTTISGMATADSSGNFSLDVPAPGFYFSILVFKTPFPVTSYVNVVYRETSCVLPHCPAPSYSTIHSNASDVATTDSYKTLYGTGYWWAGYKRDGTLALSRSILSSQLIVSTAPDASVPYQLSYGAAPEPATWALMILGFGGIGAALRSRRHPQLIVGAL